MALDGLKMLNCTLRWRSPLEVIRPAYRRRNGQGIEHVEMYGNELFLTNDRESVTDFVVHKRESDPSLVQHVRAGGTDLTWTQTPEGLVFRHRVAPGGAALVHVLYRASSTAATTPVSGKYQLSVAARRIISELRDEYVHKLYPQGAASAAK